ncbi:MAG TPA: GtrA family protein [Steroidobacteraceae bacterium]|nr:GtrA family protein [Steroidobacteraceae bacterium]
MKHATRIVVLYVVFAALAILVNLLSQALVVAVYSGPRAVELSVLAGTGTGLLVKYVLDKRYIFAFASRSLFHDSRLFTLYAFTGVFTTAIFWGCEFAFQRLYATDAMRYIGGAIGLTLGYLIKYRLDKRFVFVGGSTPPRLASDRSDSPR